MFKLLQLNVLLKMVHSLQNSITFPALADPLLPQLIRL